MGKRPDDLITATELACWGYCPEQWRLLYGLGLTMPKPEKLAVADRPAARKMEAVKRGGEVHHARKAVAERVAGGSIALGRMLLVMAVLAVILLLVWLQ